MKTKNEWINTIQLDEENLANIAKTGVIDGILKEQIQRVMEAYANQFSSDGDGNKNTKTYTVIFSEDEKRVAVSQNNRGFSPTELLGALEIVKGEVYKRLNDGG